MAQTSTRHAPTLPEPRDEAAPTPLWMPALGLLLLVFVSAWLAWKLNAGAPEDGGEEARVQAAGEGALEGAPSN